MGAAAAVAAVVIGAGSAVYSADRQRKAENTAKDQLTADRRRLDNQAALSAQSIEMRKRKERQRALGGVGFQDTILTSGLSGAGTQPAGVLKTSLGS